MSTIARVAGQLRAAGEALRLRDEDELLATLGRVLDAWRDPDGGFQRRLASTLAAAAGFSETNVREGLRLALASWDEAALRELVARELAGRDGDARIGAPLTAIVCAGSIPMPTLQQILLSLVVRSPAIVKPASRDPVTALLAAASIGEIDESLAACVGVVPLDTRDDEALGDFLAAQCVVASGSDETIAAIRARVPAATRFVGYGHRFSLAALGAPATGEEATVEALVRDLSLWDQLGCMSPVAVYAVGCTTDQRVELARALARGLSLREVEAPLGEIDVASAGVVRRERDEARMRLADRDDARVLEGDDLRWTVVLEPDATPRPCPLHRFVRVLPVADPEELDRRLAADSDRLSTLALAGLDAPPTSAPGARRCSPGQMQCPPLGAPHDGRPLLTPLLDSL